VIESKTGQRLVGLFLLALGGGFTAWTWYTALNEGYYYEKAAGIFPIAAVGGLGLLLFPMDMTKFRAEHGVDKPTTWAHYPPAWKALFVVAVLAGVGNWLALSQR
jgi:hypothetical protein